MNLIYMLKEQLQTLWCYKTYQEMDAVEVCNYAKHPLTTARVEAANVSIGLLRKRARGIRDTEYFKLKIWQHSLIGNRSMVYT
jgi:transposase